MNDQGPFADDELTALRRRLAAEWVAQSKPGRWPSALLCDLGRLLATLDADREVLEAVQAERDRLQAERDELREMHSQMCAVSAEHQRARDAAQAKVDSLAKAAVQFQGERDRLARVVESMQQARHGRTIAEFAVLACALLDEWYRRRR